ncbi:MAG: bifunctional adenosylcobinamide kinase/adenosylcobinamide-phosphate guanylyltransferase [Thermodesulfobacteriota bacterium]
METISDSRKSRIILITGGARSGKSAFALGKAGTFEGKKLFIATAEPLDAEMQRRIETHRNERGPGWDTAEVPLKLAETLKNQGVFYQIILIDCLTLWLSNMMGRTAETGDGDDRVVEAIDTLVHSLLDMQRPPQRIIGSASIYIVSNEVGMGIVPDNRAARTFRDMAGRLNQKVARIADEVYLMVCGLPLQIK